MAALFNDVIGDAIAVAVRRACDDIGRAPYGELLSSELVDPHDDDDAADDAVADRLPPPPEVDDPYEVLGIGRSASWERITAAHRRLARQWHPDGADESEREQREELLRRLNAAYAELRVRRGR
jgi:DnaJ domain